MSSIPGKVGYSEKIDVAAAVKVFEAECPTDATEQISFFKDNGFLVLRDVLTGGELDELGRELTRLTQEQGSGSLEPEQDAETDKPSYRKIGGLSRQSQAFDRLLRHQRILAALRSLIGWPIELYRDVAMMKPARVGREKPWHQDSVYWPFRPMNLVSAMTALDDATPENGCLQIIPGTHKKELQHYGAELRIDLDETLQSQATYVPLRAGDTLLFHSLLLHASQPNRSPHDRRVCIFSYKPTDLAFIGEGDPPQTIRIGD